MTGPTTSGVVIVGTGIAGVSAAETLRRRGYAGPVTLIGNEPHAPIRRTALSKDFLGADLSDERIMLRPKTFWSESGIELHTGCRVVSADPANRTVITDDPRTIPYAALILATGAQARRPDGLDPAVPTMRTRDDVLALRELVGAAEEFTIVGGGLIGLELAASAAGAGRAVTVCESRDRLMSRVVPPCVSAYLTDLHESHGVRFRLGTRIEEASPDRVVLADGTDLPGPVVAAVGTQPDVALATGLGALVTAAGITTDEALRTTVSGVYACGDAAATSHPLTGAPTRGEHWISATEQGVATADSVLADLAGVPAAEYRAVPLAWTSAYGSNIQIVGWPTAGNDVSIDGSLADGDATVIVRDGQQMVGAVTVGRPAEGRKLRARLTEHVASVLV